MKYSCPYCSSDLKCTFSKMFKTPVELARVYKCENHILPVYFDIIVHPNHNDVEVTVELWCLSITLTSDSYRPAFIASISKDHKFHVPAIYFNNKNRIELSYDWLNLSPEKIIEKYNSIKAFL